MTVKFEMVVTTLNDKKTNLKDSLEEVVEKNKEALIKGEMYGYKLAVKEIEENKEEPAVVISALEKKIAALKEGLKTVKEEYDVHFINGTIQGFELAVNEMKQID
ncbi:hypothetical protein [Bacillus bombysepticus]|uniref:hypothetical protein n=1 Tax=Bacillus bombysepticus TaxID=658666 RepID=UPI0030170080